MTRGQLLQACRIGYGAVQLFAPHAYASAVGVPNPTPVAVKVLRVLGARHVGQGVLVLSIGTPTARHWGAAVDWLHLASLLPIGYLADQRDKQLAVADACAALSFAVWGTF